MRMPRWRTHAAPRTRAAEKMLRKRLEGEYGADLTHLKQAMRAEVGLAFRRML
jgi:hypothetical protein